MADTCVCPSATNIYCQAFDTAGISVAQPTCQLIPTGDRVDNPFYDTANNVSYYTYEVIASCDGNAGATEEFLVSVCETVPIENILSVDMLVDICPDFTSLTYDFVNSGGQTPPPGYKYLRILVNGAVVPGSAAVFRIAFSGNFPAEVLPTATSNVFVILTETTLAGFLAGSANFPAQLASCPAVPQLTVNKNCAASITNNLATLTYSIDVSNTGNAVANSVSFSDTINFNGSNVNIGTIITSPDTLNVDTTTQGVIRITGDLGSFDIGDALRITYVVPITSFNAPGTYSFNNVAIAQTSEVQGSSQCNTSVEAVQLTTTSCCITTDLFNLGFGITLSNDANSPSTSTTLQSLLTVPEGVTVQFTSFDVCSAVFVDDGMPVPLITDITNRQIRVTCLMDLTPGATMSLFIGFRVVDNSIFSATPASITNTTDSVTLTNPDSQVLISVTPIPSTASIDINGLIECSSTLSNTLLSVNI